MARSVWNLFQKTVDFCTFFLNVWALYVQESQYKKNLKYVHVRTSTCLIQSSLRKIAGRVVLYEKKGTCNKTTTFRVLQNPKIILQFFFGIRLVSRSSPNVLTLIKSSWGTFWKAENQTNCYLEKKCWFNPQTDLEVRKVNILVINSRYLKIIFIYFFLIFWLAPFFFVLVIVYCNVCCVIFLG